MNRSIELKKEINKAIFLTLLLCFILLATKGESAKQAVDYTQFANPLVGAAEFGHCFPEATVPFRMIQVGPETRTGNWSYCSGYQSTYLSINSFSQTRLNGTGCPDLDDVLMLPFTGNPIGKPTKVLSARHRNKPA